MDDDILLRDDEGPVATLTLNNPGKLNALSEAMLQALEAELGLLAGEGEIRVVVLKGAGRAFCAGHDLREMTDARQAEDGGLARFRALFEQCSRVMLAITRLPQPVIAEVHGIATAAGCQLVASCDLAVAAEGARFGVNGVNIGLFCSTPMVALTRARAAQEGLRDADDRRVRRRRGGEGDRARQPGGAGGGARRRRAGSSPRRSRASWGRRSGSASGRSTSRRRWGSRPPMRTRDG